MMSPSPRIQKISDEIRRELALLMKQQMRDPRMGRVSICDVVVAKDLSSARIYISAIDDAMRAESVVVLNKAAGFLRTALAKTLQLRVTPKLTFYEDHSIEYAAHMHDVLAKIPPDDQKK
jgi:ribosome-binding factor A